MVRDEAEFLRRRQEKKERRARRKLALRQEPADTKSDISLIRANTRPSRSWTGGYGTTNEKHSDFTAVAGRSDFLKAVNREVLDATIDAGLALIAPERVRVELSFAIVRRARLFRTRHSHLLSQVIKWNADASLPRVQGRQNYEWSIEDVYLLRATAAFNNRTNVSLGSAYTTDLEWLRSNSSDPYIAVECRLLLAQNHLEEALQSRKQRQHFLNLAKSGIAHIFQRPRRKIERVRQLLDEILQADNYAGITVPRSRVRLAMSWLDRDPIKALHAIDPRRAAPSPPKDEDAGRAHAILAVESISTLAYEGAGTAVLSNMRRTYARALSAAESIDSANLEQPDLVRLADALRVIAVTHPDGSWRADHLLFQLCPNPHLPSVSAKLALLLHSHYRDKFFTYRSITDISNARIYVDAAFRKMTDNTPEKMIAAADWLITHYLYSGATSLDVDPVPILDYFDEFMPDYHPMRIEFLTYMGMSISRSPATLEKHIDRLVGYWEKHLELVKDMAQRGQNTTAQLAEALENTAISLRLRARANDDSRDLARALKLSREGYDLVGYDDRLRTAAVYSYILNEWSIKEGLPEDRAEAVDIQTKVLRRVRNKAKRDILHPVSVLPGRWALMSKLPRILEMTFPVTRDESEECFEALTWLNNHCLEDDSADLKTSLSEAALLCQSALSSDEWEYSSKLALKALKRVERTLTSVENPYSALYFVQGLSSIGAVAFASRGNSSQAAQILERGAALRTRIQLQRRRYETTPTETEDTSAPSTHTTRVSSLENYHQIKGLAAALSAPLVYLSATEATGLAVVVTAETCRSILLPELTLAKVNQWLDLSSTDMSVRQESRGIPVRGARGEQSPARTAVDKIIAEAAYTIQSLQEMLAETQCQTVHVIPVGQTAGLPWSYIFSVAVTINPSATILNRSRMQTSGNGPRISITAPSPCHHEGEHLEHLKNARKEGLWLSENAGFDSSATGPAATRHAFNEALKSGPEVLHVAAHGSVNTRSWGDAAHLIWADDENSIAETTSLPELMELDASNVGTVFLAACWGGAPNRTLPDESISFPTAFLTAGAKSVIAPLWPIDDDVAYELATLFYEYWKLDGISPAIALRMAATKMRDAHPDSSTWAAFMLAGDI
ncbi:CHAT domain-containing protein [Pseudarthrobacter sp. B4EP4b]|uniref:CHAT domain-containing protein n=1 Tax=Pseudarthrobacter sp. B4EP4b TaxID=2590664 RepID=UPI00114E8478|nr:CHAT domain-containing protein [Pseudarthrobacter sp. B4EP4b]